MKYIDADLIKSIQSLYSDIDSCIDELLKARVEHNQENEGKALFRMEGLMVGTLQQLSCIIDSLQQEQPSLPSNLDEAAEDFVWEVMENDEDGISDLSQKLRPTSKINDFYDALAEFFKAGAEWAMEQGVKATGTISPRGIIYDNNVGYHLFLERYHNGDKVEVQIRKIEENGK